MTPRECHTLVDTKNHFLKIWKSDITEWKENSYINDVVLHIVVVKNLYISKLSSEDDDALTLMKSKTKSANELMRRIHAMFSKNIRRGY